MHPLPHASLRLGALVVVLGAGLATPKAVDELVSRAQSAGPETAVHDPGIAAAGVASAALDGFRPTPVPRGTLPEDAPRCSVSVAYADDVPAAERVTLTDLVSDRPCPSDLNTTVGLTFEVDNPKAGRSLWWRRAESSFDVLYPSSGSIPGRGRNRVSLSNLVLDQSVTIEVLDQDQRLMSFTLKHF
jgi:hypothetical protein